jgi:hypothetical protein
VELVLELPLAARADEVHITPATPKLDTRKHGNGTNVDQVMLNDLPTARDPWVRAESANGTNDAHSEGTNLTDGISPELSASPSHVVRGLQADVL